MSKSEQAVTDSEIERGFQFLATLCRGGKVFSLLLPILSDLKVQSEREKIQQDASAGATSSIPMEEENCHKSMVLLIHKAMCEEKFVCIIEKASSVPGFAAPIRELAAHVLPDGWDSNLDRFTFMYKNKAKPGKQFMLTCSTLLEGNVLGAIVTEKNGASFAVELEVEDYSGPSRNKEDVAAALKAQVQSLVWQLIPQLNTATSSAESDQASRAQSSLRAPSITPAQPASPYNDPFSDGRGGFIPTPIMPQPGSYQPRFPGVGGGDLHPSFPGAPMPGLPDNGQGSLVGPGHPLFNPRLGGSSSDPFAPQGWPAGMPQPRFDPFMPVTGPNGPNLGPNLGPQGPRLGPMGGRGARRRFPGEPNADHLIPPGDDNEYI